MEPQIYQLGTPIRLEELILPKARELVGFVLTQGSMMGCSLEGFVQVGPAAQGVCLKFETERPQHCIHAIERFEPVVVIFHGDPELLPSVFPLRSNFPSCPHMNLSGKGLPRTLCLYAEPPELVQLIWTPAKFIQRIHHWFTHTATGDLHGDDQPLEGLLGEADGLLVLPSSVNWAELTSEASTEFYRISPDEVKMPFLMMGNSEIKPKPEYPRYSALFVEANPHTHGVVDYKPSNLPELCDLLAPVGVDLLASLRQHLAKVFQNKGNPAAEAQHVVVIVRLPKTRTSSSSIERFDTYAFLVMEKAGQIGLALDVLRQQDGALVAFSLLGAEPNVSVDALAKIGVITLNCVADFDSKIACALSRSRWQNTPIAVVGVGSIGSQVVTNLTRAGIAKWHLVDGDVMSPHNSARHALSRANVGRPKVEGVARKCKDILADAEIGVTACKLDVFRDELPNALQNGCAKWVFDFSASMAVSRWIAKRDGINRALSAFLTPNGEGLIVLVEDEQRQFRLDWLEMLHYRAILNTKHLHDVLAPPRGKLRYGWSCRDISFEMPQDVVSQWAATIARVFRKEGDRASAIVRIYHAKEDGAGEVTVTDVSIAPLVNETLGGWEITTDLWFLKKLRRLRKQQLPAETGGVLLGTFDTLHRRIYLVDALPAPPDSKGTPSYFERGFVGLADSVRRVQAISADQLQYVGEWHSHPPRCSANPSAQDIKLLAWQAELMGNDSLPGVMLIIGNRSHKFLLGQSIPCC